MKTEADIFLDKVGDWKVNKLINERLKKHANAGELAATGNMLKAYCREDWTAFIVLTKREIVSNTVEQLRNLVANRLRVEAWEVEVSD